MSRQRKPAPTEVFISHSSRNTDFAIRLRDVVANHGINSFVSKAHIQAAQQWHDEIGAALKRCDWFLLILSPAAVRSSWVKFELVYALQSSSYQGRILPLLLKNCDKESLSWTLPAIEWVDFRGDFDLACEQMFKIWR